MPSNDIASSKMIDAYKECYIDILYDNSWWRSYACR
jgi:hypothetical protein